VNSSESPIGLGGPSDVAAIFDLLLIDFDFIFLCFRPLRTAESSAVRYSFSGFHEDDSPRRSRRFVPERADVVKWASWVLVVMGAGWKYGVSEEEDKGKKIK